ncbi:hypothetical protein ACFY4C_41675 [Actinomadura viridis]|uniref:hypothetical protein n=1 Tax=Actinomadura viridis TaxID=58110 RepID=UPI0036C8D913
MKAKLFINRAMDDDESRSFDEQALWAALALELLAKAALARVSPLLVAEPTEEGTNLLIASGLVEGDARFTSVRAKTLFARCQKAFKPFSLAEATAITKARNEYLHSSGTGFMAIPQNVWWSKFWAQAIILVTALDQDLSTFIGSDREEIATKFLDLNAKNVEHRTEALITRAKQRLQQYRTGTLPARLAAEMSMGLDLTAGLPYREAAECPACGSNGILEGQETTNAQVDFYRVAEENYEAFVTLTVESDYFSCTTCKLTLDRYEYVQQAGLPTAFEAEGDESDVYLESEYGND